MLSVIIPAYKAKDTICDTLDSLVAQTKKEFFTIIVQDADGEDYSNIIEEYRNRGLHIKHINLDKNLGPGGARQHGFDSCKMCDYVTFLDADDIYMPYTVERMYTEAKKGGFDIGIGKWLIERKDHSLIPASELKTGNTWFINKIFKRDFLEKHHIHFALDIRLNEDAYFNGLCNLYEPKKGELDLVVGIQRNNPQSLTRKDDYKFAKKSLGDFLYGQILLMMKRIELGIKLDQDMLIAFFYTLYNYHQQAMCVCANIEKYLEYREKLKANPTFIEALRNPLVYKYLTYKQYPQGMYVNKKPIMYKQTLHVWLKTWLGDLI